MKGSIMKEEFTVDVEVKEAAQWLDEQGLEALSEDGSNRAGSPIKAAYQLTHYNAKLKKEGLKS